MSSRLQFLTTVASLALAVYISSSVINVPVGTMSEAVQYAVSGLSPFLGLIATFTLNRNAHCGLACTTFKAALLTTVVVPCAAHELNCSRFQYEDEPVARDVYKKDKSTHGFRQTCETRACYQALVQQKGTGKDYLFRGCLQPTQDTCKPPDKLYTAIHEWNMNLVRLKDNFKCCSADMCNEPYRFDKWNQATIWTHDPSTSTTATTKAVPATSVTKSKPSEQTAGNANHTVRPQPPPAGSSTTTTVRPGPKSDTAKKRFGPLQYASIGVLAVCIIGMLITGILFCVALSGKICAAVEPPSADVPIKQLDPSML